MTPKSPFGIVLRPPPLRIVEAPPEPKKSPKERLRDNILSQVEAVREVRLKIFRAKVRCKRIAMELLDPPAYAAGEVTWDLETELNGLREGIRLLRKSEFDAVTELRTLLIRRQWAIKRHRR